MASVRKLKPDDPKSPWIVEYTDAGGKRRRKTPKSGLKKDAEKIRVQIEHEMGTGLHVADSQSATVSKAIDLWCEACENRIRVRDKLRPRTFRSWQSMIEHHIRPQLGHLRLNQVTFRHVQQYVNDLAYDRIRPRSRAIIENCLCILRLVFKEAYVRGLVGRNVVKDDADKLRIPGREAKPRAVPERATVARMLEWSDRRTGSGGVAPYLKPALYVAVFAGLRLGEILALEWGDVDFDKNLILVRRGADNLGYVDDPKSRAGIRDVPIAPQLRVELQRWRGRVRVIEGLVFRSRSGRMLTQAHLSASYHRMQYRAAHGGEGTTVRRTGDYTFHSLRHVAASLWIESGMPPKRVMTLMGHSSIQMTFDRYGHLFEDQGLIDGAVTRMGSLLAA